MDAPPLGAHEKPLDESSYLYKQVEILSALEQKPNWFKDVVKMCDSNAGYALYHINCLKDDNLVNEKYVSEANDFLISLTDKAKALLCLE